MRRRLPWTGGLQLLASHDSRLLCVEARSTASSSDWTPRGDASGGLTQPYPLRTACMGSLAVLACRGPPGERPSWRHRGSLRPWVRRAVGRLSTRHSSNAWVSPRHRVPQLGRRPPSRRLASQPCCALLNCDQEERLLARASRNSSCLTASSAQRRSREQMQQVPYTAAGHSMTSASPRREVLKPDELVPICDRQCVLFPSQLISVRRAWSRLGARAGVVVPRRQRWRE
jgi:hypothetical protein